MSFSNRTGFMHEVAMRDYAGTGRPEMMLKNRVAVMYGAGGAVGSASPAHSRARAPGFFSLGVTGHRSKFSPRKSLPRECPLKWQRSTRLTNKRWTGICGP
jgi:hypothetical protein